MLRGRYAPSPTGHLHLGNARTALVAWLHARSQQGCFIMRIEDLDRQRSKDAFVATNLDELRWLGLDWDEGPGVGGPYGPYQQSQREAHYQQAFERLQSQGLVFACYLSRKDLKDLASAPHGSVAIYGSAERHENERRKATNIAAAKAPSFRLQSPELALSFTDLLHGPQQVQVARDIGHMILRRADAMWAYQLAVVVDDIAMKISHVLRADDLLASSGAQVLLYHLLAAPPPSFIHIPLLLDDNGERMAKRKGSNTLSALREQGVKAERIVGVLAHSLGLVPELAACQPENLIADFSLDKLKRSAVSLSPEALAWMRA